MPDGNGDAAGREARGPLRSEPGLPVTAQAFIATAPTWGSPPAAMTSRYQS
jgi:hypothetical protein